MNCDLIAAYSSFSFGWVFFHTAGRKSKNKRQVRRISQIFPFKRWEQGGWDEEGTLWVVGTKPAAQSSWEQITAEFGNPDLIVHIELLKPCRRTEVQNSGVPVAGGSAPISQLEQDHCSNPGSLCHSELGKSISPEEQSAGPGFTSPSQVANNVSQIWVDNSGLWEWENQQGHT